MSSIVLAWDVLCSAYAALVPYVSMPTVANPPAPANASTPTMPNIHLEPLPVSLFAISKIPVWTFKRWQDAPPLAFSHGLYLAVEVGADYADVISFIIAVVWLYRLG